MTKKTKKRINLGAPNPAGYCLHHHSTMSVNQIRAKKCLMKNCRHFRKVKAHPWWAERERKKDEKRRHKNGEDNHLDK